MGLVLAYALHLFYFFDYILLIMLCSCPNFSPFAPSSEHPPLPKAIHTPLFMSMGHVYRFFDSSISYTVLYIPMAILELPVCIC